MVMNMVLVLHYIKRLPKSVRQQPRAIYQTCLRKNVSSNWKVVDVIHAIRSIRSYRDAQQSKTCCIKYTYLFTFIYLFIQKISKLLLYSVMIQVPIN